MSEAEIQEREEIEVLDWRAETLERAGFDRLWAHALAGVDHVDLHRAVDLLRRGCAPELAVRILL